MAKTQLTLWIESDVITKLKIKKINISQLSESFYKSYLSIPKEDLDIGNLTLESDIEKARAKLLQLEQEQQKREKQDKNEHTVVIKGGS